KPVIATRYGGNLEFMTDENSYLVRWKPTTVGEDAIPYPAHGVWADPDIDHAAELMRRVLDDRPESTARGGRGRRDVPGAPAPGVAGLQMQVLVLLVVHAPRAERERAAT